MDAIHRRARTHHRVQTENRHVWMLGLHSVNQVNLGAYGKNVTGFPSLDRFANVFGRTYTVGGLNYRRRTFGMNDHLRVGVVGSSLVDLVNREAIMYEAIPDPHTHVGILV